MSVIPEDSASGFPELRLLDVEQLAELWGVKKSWIYDQVEAGRLPAIRLGGLLRFKESVLLDYLETHGGSQPPVVVWPAR